MVDAGGGVGGVEELAEFGDGVCAGYCGFAGRGFLCGVFLVEEGVDVEA